MQKKNINRWFILPGVLLIQISLGSLFIYSFYKPFLAERFPDWNNVDLALPSQFVLVSFALGILISGILQDRYKPRRLSLTGGFLLGSGLIISSFSRDLTLFTIGYGVIGGFGIGTAFVCSVATVIKWFPDKPGLINGISFSGFGAGALIFTPIAKYFIYSIGIMDTFLVLGIFYLVMITIGSTRLVNPPDGYAPKGYDPQKSPSRAHGAFEFTSLEMARTYQFKILWFAYFVGSSSGLLVLMNVTNIWQSYSLLDMFQPGIIINRSTFDGIIAKGAAAVITISVMNASGRIIWGKISDKFGRKNTLPVMFLICASALFVLIYAAQYPVFLVSVSLVVFCYGGFTAIFSVIIADFYGTKNLGSNYGWLTTSYGFGGLFGPYLAPKLMKLIENVPYEYIDKSGIVSVRFFEAGNYYLSLVIIGSLCIITSILFIFMKPPVK